MDRRVWCIRDTRPLTLIDMNLIVINLYHSVQYATTIVQDMNVIVTVQDSSEM